MKNREQQHDEADSYSLRDLARTGFWFCRRCLKVTSRGEQIEAKCDHCGSYAVVWCPPVPE